MTTQSAASPVDEVIPVNYYEVFGWDRDSSLEELKSKLRVLKMSWQSRASRAGNHSEQARETLEQLKGAEQVFSDDDERDRYDRSLRRSATSTATAEPVTDWNIKAWNYYFNEDDGAAGVAARKAKEIAPNDALVYVVSAWINIREGEVRQAKRDSDEAFVLDDLGEDTADVHHVRGFVFFLNGDHSRAMQSYDRALAKASEGEKVEILARYALALESTGDYSSALDKCLEGLGLQVEVRTDVTDWLHKTFARTAVRLAEKNDPPSGRKRVYTGLKSRVQASSMTPSSKNVLNRQLDQFIAFEDLRARKQDHERVAEPGGDKEGIPWLVAGGGLFALIFLSQLWWGFAILGLGAIAFAGYRIYQGQQWTQAQNEYESAQNRLQENIKQIAKMRTQVYPYNERAALNAAPSLLKSY